METLVTRYSISFRFRHDGTPEWLCTSRWEARTPHGRVVERVREQFYTSEWQVRGWAKVHGVTVIPVGLDKSA
jgi:hypothetical protein